MSRDHMKPGRPHVHRVGLAALLVMWFPLLIDPALGQWSQFFEEPLWIGGYWQPRIVSDGHGGAIIGWRDPGGVQRLDSLGYKLWGNSGVRYTPDSDGSWTPGSFVMAPDKLGGVIVAWEKRYRLHPFFPMFDIEVYLQRVDKNGDLLWPLEGTSPALLDTLNNRIPQAFFVYPDQSCVFIWLEGEKDDHGSSPFFLYAQLFSPEGDRLWGEEGVVIASISQWESFRNILRDEADGFLLVTSWRIIRISKNGSLVWEVPSPGSFYPVAVEDGEGGLIMVSMFQSSTSPTGKAMLMAHRVDANGNYVWGDYFDGVFVSEHLNERQFWGVDMIPDERGGAILSWPGEQFLIRVQKISQAGMLQWDDSQCFGYGALTSGGGYHTAIVPDGAGGLVRVSTDSTNHNVIRINDTGHQGWGGRDVPVIIRTHTVESVQVASDGHGGIIVSWWRPGWGIFCHRVDKHGNLGGVTLVNAGRNSKPTGISLRQNYPNPFFMSGRHPRSTRMQYTINSSSYVEIEIFDSLGRRIARLFQGNQPPGSYVIQWSGEDDNGVSVFPGVYWVRLKTGRVLKTIPITVVR